MKKNQRYYLCRYLLLLGFCVSLAVLAMAAQKGSESAAVLFPLSQGQSWVYRAYVKGSDKDELDSEPQFKESKSYINDIITVDGVDWYQLEEYDNRFWIRNSGAGQMEAVNLFGMKSEDLKGFNPKALREELVFKFPAKEGEVWNAMESTLRYEGLETKKVPAGTFQCHSYAMIQDGIVYSHSCIAEGMGVIYSDSLLENGLYEVSELLFFSSEI